MTRNNTKTEFSNVANPVKEPTVYRYDAETDNYVEKPVSTTTAKSAQRHTGVYYNPEKNGYDEPGSP